MNPAVRLSPEEKHRRALEAQTRLRRERRAAGSCVRCGEKDDRTRRGMHCCGRCARREADYYYKKKEKP